jgi:tRNA dimethylallyltransferase
LADPRSAQFLVALYGPTSSGKTKLSVDLAHLLRQRFGRAAVVIAADSRQVYRYMDIGTSKTTPQQMRGIRHELIDVAEPARKLELAEYSALARAQIGRCLAAGAIPLIVGGTGIYVKALLEGWDVEAAGPVRDSLKRDFPRSMISDAHAMLRRLDRDLADRIHANNYEAIINALAAVMAPGQRKAGQATAGMTQVLLGLDPGPARVDAAVVATYDEQIRRGLGAEIADLAARYDLDHEYRRRGVDSPNQVLHTHGYREYFEVASDRGKTVNRLNDRDLADVRSAVTDHIRQYTRRQRSWFRKLPAVRMVSDAEQALAAIAVPKSGGR